MPAYCGLVGHDRDDLLKKTAVHTAFVHHEPSTYKSVPSLADSRWLALLYDGWDASAKGRELIRQLSRPDRKGAWWRPNRAILDQFRVGRCPTDAYFGQFRENYNTRCCHCNEDVEIIDHIFYEVRVRYEGRSGKSFE